MSVLFWVGVIAIFYISVGVTLSLKLRPPPSRFKEWVRVALLWPLLVYGIFGGGQ